MLQNMRDRERKRERELNISAAAAAQIDEVNPRADQGRVDQLLPKFIKLQRSLKALDKQNIIVIKMSCLYFVR